MVKVKNYSTCMPKINEANFPMRNVSAAEPSPASIISNIFLLILISAIIATMKPIAASNNAAVMKDNGRAYCTCSFK